MLFLLFMGVNKPVRCILFLNGMTCMHLMRQIVTVWTLSTLDDGYQHTWCRASARSVTVITLAGKGLSAVLLQCLIYFLISNFSFLNTFLTFAQHI